MSHNIEHFTYPKNVNKAQVQKNLDNYVAHADWQEGCTGLYNNIRWLDNKVYESEDEAREAIKKMDRGCYDQLAVLFQNHQTPDDEKVRELNSKAAMACHEWNRRDRILYAETVTSTFIGCKKCGSRLARVMLCSNSCPVCHAELRPEHMIKSVASAKSKWDKAQRDVAEYIKKKGKTDVMWLVKIEYHT